MKAVFNYDLHYARSESSSYRSALGTVTRSHVRGVYLGSAVPVRLINDDATGFSRATRAVFHNGQKPLGHAGRLAIQVVAIPCLIPFALAGAAVGLVRRHGRFSHYLTAGQRMKVGAALGLGVGVLPAFVASTPVAVAFAIPAVVVGSAAALVASPVSLAYHAVAAHSARSRAPLRRGGLG